MYASNKVVVGSGFATKGKDKPLAILTLLHSTDSSTFALVFSISHVIADGRTYYDIFNMLSPGTSVRELNPARVMTFSETMRDACGRKELAWMDSLPAICMMIPVMACPKKPVCCAFEIDPARVEEMKGEALRGAKRGAKRGAENLNSNPSTSIFTLQPRPLETVEFLT